MIKGNKRTLVALTGGGTAGHVMPHIALLPYFRERGINLIYIGSSGIEMNLAQLHGLEFYKISAGKLRRYFSWQNLVDVFKVFGGILQSLIILSRKRPDVVFSKGGYVSVPVAIAAWLLKIPVVTHESDLTPGLANKIIMNFAKKILFSFPETKLLMKSSECEWTGLPVRDELLSGNKSYGFKMCGFNETQEYPVLLVMGGSLGAQRLNETLLVSLPQLVKNFCVIHITGRGKKVQFSHERYKSFEFLNQELKHIFAITRIVISRSGANSIFEFLTAGIPMILIPLESGSRGDQLENAEYFSRKNWAKMLRESSLDNEVLLSCIQQVLQNEIVIKIAQKEYTSTDICSRVLTNLFSVIS